MINGPNCKVFGNNNILNGPNCYAQGNNNTMNGPNCTAKGNNNKLAGPGCSAVGTNNKVNVDGDNYGIAQSVINNTFSDDGGAGCAISISMGPGGMRIFRDGVEQEPFVVAKKDKKKKKERKSNRREKEPDEPVFIEGPTAADLAADKEAKDNETQCIICLTNSPCCIANPCNHLSFCVACARALCFASMEDERPKQVGELACPKCKEVVEKIKRVFE